MVSSTAVMETQFTEQFREALRSERDPVLRKLREKAFAAFAEMGFPAVKSEDWKYTNVAPIAGGQWSVASGQSGRTADVDSELLNRFNIRRNGFAALNLAFAEFTVIRIPKETVAAEPIELSFAGEENSAIFPHIFPAGIATTRSLAW